MTAAGEQLLSARAADTVAAVTGPANRTGAQLARLVPAPSGRRVVAGDRGEPVRGARSGAVRAVRVGQPEQSAQLAGWGC